ncbi:hypothetical protein M3J09_006503 [Ascochyta lentis]
MKQITFQRYTNTLRRLHLTHTHQVTVACHCRLKTDHHQAELVIHDRTGLCARFARLAAF